MLSSQAPSGTSTPNGPSMVSMEMCGHPLASNIPNNIPLVNNNGNGTGSVQMISQQQIAQLACSQQQMPPPQHSMQQQSQQYPQQQNIQRNPQQHFQQQGIILTKITDRNILSYTAKKIFFKGFCFTIKNNL